MKIIVEGKMREGKSTIVEIIVDALLKHEFELNISEDEMRENSTQRVGFIKERIEAIKGRVGQIRIETKQLSRYPQKVM